MMTIWDRVKVISVLFAMVAIILSIVDFFFFPVDINSIFSPILVLLLVVAFWFVAPRVAKYIKIGKSPDRT